MVQRYAKWLDYICSSDFGIAVGLYRNYGLCACKLSPRQTELMKKKLCQILKENGLTITVEANVRNGNFWDINLDKEMCTFKPIMQKNEYRGVKRRLSAISAKEEALNKLVTVLKTRPEGKKSKLEREKLLISTHPSHRKSKATY
jgi:hypothetical protein